MIKLRPIGHSAETTPAEPLDPVDDPFLGAAGASDGRQDGVIGWLSSTNLDSAALAVSTDSNCPDWQKRPGGS